ncbi:MAG: hypothetical protein STSR0007_14160 [Thermovirga sp.]
MSGELLDAVEMLRSFLYSSVYASESVLREEPKVEHILRTLFENFEKNPAGGKDTHRGSAVLLALDQISGMTDRYALQLFENIAVLNPWP